MTAVYVFGGIMAVLLLAVVFAPLVEDRLRTGTSDPRTAAERKEAAVEALREIEFEYQTGKLSEEDYSSLRARYAREAVAARDEVEESAADGVCSSCRADVPPGTRFCSRCGAAVN